MTEQEAHLVVWWNNEEKKAFKGTFSLCYRTKYFFRYPYRKLHSVSNTCFWHMTTYNIILYHIVAKSTIHLWRCTHVEENNFSNTNLHMNLT